MFNPAIPSDANALLHAHGLRPRKRWGQNFLCDQNVLDRIVRAAALQSGDYVLEIGPGLGGLTRTLASQSPHVTAIEIDPLLQPILLETLAGLNNVSVIYQDFLKLDLAELLHSLEEEKGRRGEEETKASDQLSVISNQSPTQRPSDPTTQRPTPNAQRPTPITVVANIPYYITSPIIERLFEHKARIQTIVLLVQLEVAERLTASPGTDAYGSMSIFAQYHSQVEVIGKVSKHVFLPQPDVDSAIVRLTPVVPGTVPVKAEEWFFKIVRASFGQRRKTILNALTGGGIGLDRGGADSLLRNAGIDPGRRGETLNLSEFAKLSDANIAG